MMQIKGFKQAVKRLAGKKYHTVEQKITEWSDGQISYIWCAYIEGGSWTQDYSTPEEALAELKEENDE